MSLKRAAEYVRMSTERQEYSPIFQRAALAAYAAEHGYEIVRSYADEGVSGLTIDRRSGLKQLLADALSEPRPFEVVLVYDVSRWGRFQNPDQAAHYEFVCADAGAPVHYCAEPFENDGSPAATLLKHVKRAMAAEFSRELSDKTIRAKHGLRAQGFWPGGPPGYGLRRQIITPDGRRLAIREHGDFKGNQGTRTIIVWGPHEEIVVVRRIYRLFLKQQLGFQGIALRLNAEGVPAEGGHAWTRWRVTHVLTHPKYIGTLVFRRASQRLSKPRRLPSSEWLYLPDMLPAIISKRTFRAAQRAVLQQRRPWTRSEMLEGLREVLAQEGKLSAKLIRSAASVPAPEHYLRIFGGLLKAYELIGYAPSHHGRLDNLQANLRLGRPRTLTDDQLLDALRQLFTERGELTRRLITSSAETPSVASYMRRFGSMAAAYERVGYAPSARQRASFCGAATRAVRYGADSHRHVSRAEPGASAT